MKKEEKLKLSEQDRLEKKFREIDAKALRLKERPNLESCKECLVKFQFDSTRQLSNFSGTWGYVMSIDPQKRLLQVNFYDSVKRCMFLESIPFDHPILSWFHVLNREMENNAAATMIQKLNRGR